MSIYGKKQWGQFAPSTLNYQTHLPALLQVENGLVMCLDMIPKPRPTIAPWTIHITLPEMCMLQGVTSEAVSATVE